MMYMTNDEYKHYIFEQKRKGRSEEQIAESMGIRLEEFLALQNRVFGTPIAETVQEPVVEAVAEPEPEPEPVVVDFVNPLFQEVTPPTPVTVEEDESWAD